jgi:UDP-N-acetylmuramate dehydrogenase
VTDRLADHTTLRLGGPAQRWVRAGTETELVEAVREADARGEPALVLGGGSNLVVADEGFAGTVLEVATHGVEVEGDTCGGAVVTVQAGEVWDTLVDRAVAEGWVGIEAMTGIPGLVGATPIQNVGAYGQEVADTVARVRVLDRHDGGVHTLFPDDCGFGYRTSRFKREPGRFVVLTVTFQLRYGNLSAPLRYAELARTLGVEVGERAPSAEVRDAVRGLRASKGMLLDPDDHDTWSAGSFFTNPVLGPEAVPDGAPVWEQADGRVKTSAAWLIDKAGFGKGFHLGDRARASLSTKHPLALTNRGGATTEELLALARTVRDGVRHRFGVVLENEPVLVGCAL